MESVHFNQKPRINFHFFETDLDQAAAKHHRIAATFAEYAIVKATHKILC